MKINFHIEKKVYFYKGEAGLLLNMGSIFNNDNSYLLFFTSHHIIKILADVKFMNTSSMENYKYGWRA